jgi:hypothetical protein
VYVLSFSQILDRPQHRWDGTAAASTPIETDLRKRYSLEPLDVVDERWHAFVDVPDMESPVFPPALGKDKCARSCAYRYDDTYPCMIGWEQRSRKRLSLSQRG